MKEKYKVKIFWIMTQRYKNVLLYKKIYNNDKDL